MDTGTNDDREAALRPLRTIGGVVSSLRAGDLSAEEERSAVIQVTSAAESSLRRLLRDQPDVALPVRLRALAPDELSSDEVLAELRQHDRISIELAASVHDLFEVRRRLKEGGSISAGDGDLAYRVASRLEQEALTPPSRAASATPSAVDQTVFLPVDPAEDTTAGGRRRVNPFVALGAFLLLAAIGLGIWAMSRRNTASEMDQGIVLFRNGSYADAAPHFYRYAQENPDDATPHLYLARIHRLLERNDLAVPELRSALELAPTDPDVHTELGILLSDAGRFDEAVVRFREAIRLDPEAPTPWVGLVRALRAGGAPQTADSVLARAPADVRAMLARQPPSPPNDTVP